MTILLQTSSHFRQVVRTVFRLKGVYPSVITPFRDAEKAVTSRNKVEIDFIRFERILDHVKRHPIAGIALLGYSGEATSLTWQQQIELVKHARYYLGFSTVILVGAGVESTGDTVDLVNKMAEAGASACFVYKPSFFCERVDQRVYFDHFQTVANHAIVPTILYNRPTNSVNEIPISVILELAKHPNIVGMLDRSRGIVRMASVLWHTSRMLNNKPFDVVIGSVVCFMPALLAGCRGTVCALANILPKEIVQLQHLVEQGHYNEAQQLYRRLILPDEIVTKKYGVVGLKTVLNNFNCVDFGDQVAGRVNSTLGSLSEKQVFESIQAFKDNGFLLSEKQMN